MGKTKVVYGVDIRDDDMRVPFISIKIPSVDTDVVLTANITCATDEDAYLFCRALYETLSGIHENVRFSETGDL